MTHITEKLQGYLEGALDAAEKAVVESHLAGCAQCRAEAEEWRSLMTALSSMPRVAPAPGFANRVMAGVRLPDPWYAKAAARMGSRLQRLAPTTTRGWAVATACLGLPIAVFGTLIVWLFSQPYVSPQALLTFGLTRAQTTIAGFAQGAFSAVLQTQVGMWLARGVEAITSAGLGTAGALAAAVAIVTVLSAWILYQNLFRTTTRENYPYVSYSF